MAKGKTKQDESVEAEELRIHNLKREVRNATRSQRRAMDPQIALKASERIQRAVMALPEYGEAATIGCYLGLPHEVHTRRIIEDAWHGNKRVCVPAWNHERERYELVWFGREDTTLTGRWDINEPEERDKAGVMDVDLIVVPALAYDPSGRRLGHGGGHYDRMLGAWSGYKVGVAFDFQVFDEVPAGSQDIPVDVVVTEQHFYDADGEAHPVEILFDNQDK